MPTTVRLGAGMAFWGDSVQPAITMAERGEIDYLCCDHLAELTMSILSKQRKRPGLRLHQGRPRPVARRPRNLRRQGHQDRD